MKPIQVLPAVIASLLLHAAVLGALVAGAHRAEDARPMPVSLSVSLVEPALPIAAAAPDTAAPAPPGKIAKPQPTRAEPLKSKPQPRKPEPKPEADPRPVGDASMPAPTDAAPREEPVASTSSSIAAQNSAGSGPAVTAAPPQRTRATIASYAATNRKPTYPRLARSGGEQGTVVLRVLVQADGAVGTLDVARSSGYPLLDEAARAAVRQWRFHPATVDGKPVAEWHDVPILFTLHEP